MAEWAPQYSKAERIRLLLFHAAWAVPLFLLTEFSFSPGSSATWKRPTVTTMGLLMAWSG